MTPDLIPVRENGDLIINEWFNTIRSAMLSDVTTTLTISGNIDNSGIYLVDASGGSFSLSLPEPSANPAANGIDVTLKRIDGTANVVTIEVDGGANIDGKSSITLDVQFEAVRLVNNGSQYYIIG